MPELSSQRILGYNRYQALPGYKTMDGSSLVQGHTLVTCYVLTDDDTKNTLALGIRGAAGGETFVLDRDSVVNLLKFIDEAKIINVD